MRLSSIHRVVLALGVLGSWACSKDSTTPPQSASLQISVSPKVVSQGSSADVSVLATDAGGAFGTGTVTLVPSAGTIGGQAQATLDLSNGQATGKWICDPVTTPACQDGPVITATWNGVTAQASATFGQSSSPDAGASDGGSRGSDGGADAALVQTGMLNLTASKNQIFFGVGDHADVTARLGTDAGVVYSDAGIVFTTTLGGFSDPSVAISDGGAAAVTSTLTVNTNSQGLAVARFWETGTPGAATITATHAATQSQGEIQINIDTVQQITWASTKCNKSDCTVLGIKGSNYNEQAQVTFAVVDASGKPVSGVDVSFSIPNAPLGTTVDPTGVTDLSGLVTVNVQAGTAVGAFAVKAVVIPGAVYTESNAIGVRGARPSNQSSFVFQCLPVNVPAYVSADQKLADIPVNCTVKLVDRFNNPVGTGTHVQFFSEAGSINNDTGTTAYEPGASNPSEGIGTVVFKTGSSAAPTDVAPLAADSNQFPFSRDAEPSVQVDALVHNPRDSLVTIIASVQGGEEYFWDLNQNGVRDDGEPFIDQGEPFVDENDNGVWDKGEFFVDTNGNLKYDGPNGKWDGDTTIWTEAQILYTGLPAVLNMSGFTASGLPPNHFATACNNGLQLGQSVSFDGLISDAFLNVLPAGTTFNFSNQCSNGSFTSTSRSPMLDTYGFRMERVLLDQGGAALCNKLGSDGQQPSENLRVEASLWLLGRWSVPGVGDAERQPHDEHLHHLQHLLRQPRRHGANCGRKREVDLHVGWWCALARGRCRRGR